MNDRWHSRLERGQPVRVCLSLAGLVRVLLFVFLSNAADAAEPPVRDGLILWVDAATQGTYSQQPVDTVTDSSPRGLRGFQLAPEHRPVGISDGQAAYFKFDGKDDFLAFTGAKESAAELTVIILAAPKSNPGNFSALCGLAANSKNDYTSGLNLDFGPASTKDLSVINVECPGCQGARDLLGPGFVSAGERPFGGFHVFTARSKIGNGGVELFLDGFKGGARDRTDSTIALDHIVVGARLYSNDPTQPPFAQGFFDGAIAEVLIYNRAVTEDERRTIEQTLLAKTVALNGLLSGAKGHALETVNNPPVVQMLVPGFTVQELPLKIVNLNNVRYRHDGKLVGLGYDGRIHLLTDTDGDGIEDHSELFWAEQTLRAPIGMDLRSNSVFVASKGKVSVITDTNADGRGDEEKVIAGGWPELGHGVDTLGLALDPKDGSVYFGLGCANFVDAYLIDRATGKSQYRLDSIRGTIQRISPDFSKRETVCTGVRFTCALAFNEAGDLFATDQEGATWLANGNPLDELLHIVKGKHYGFPPRHPKHLPNVRDEPPISEYAPQHQSTVGMVFNSGFGPAHWRGDAIVCGESRGKLWRTKLAKTPLGYVAQNHLIACLSLLTVDACVSPQGDLVVACHSGPPDWGTGPAGEGRIFKIHYAGRDLPQPVLAWAAAPDEFRVAFDRPLEPSDWLNAARNVNIEAGQFVSAGDRFEVIRPGYQVVRDQMSQPRRSVDLLGLTMSEDRRTLVLRVPRQTEAVNYAITLPLPERWRQRAGITQHPQIDVALSLNGVLAVTDDARCVLPHPSVAASKTFTAGSAEHEAFLKEPRFTVRTVVDRSDPFAPAVQPGSKLDWDRVVERFDVRTDSAISGDKILEFAVSKDTQTYLAKNDLRHPLATTRVYVPWAMRERQPPAAIAQTRSDVKGHWLRGRRVFFTDGGCGTCHTIRNEGTAFGPDLSNLIHRDRDSVLQDILHPSATINPDHAGTMLTLKDGTSVAGIVRSMKDKKVVLALPAGAQMEYAQGTIAATEPMRTSLMPEGLRDIITAQQLEDLLTFLLVNPLDPAPITRTDPPMPQARRLAEVENFIAPPSAGDLTPLRILLCAGPKDHGIDEHDYPLWLERWSRLLALAENVTVKTATGFPTGEQLANADVTVFFNANPGWSEANAKALDAYHERGGGAVYLHYAVDGGKAPDLAAERFGLAFTLGSRFRHGEFDLVYTQPDHPITRSLPKMHLTDESYWKMRGDVSRIKVLGTSLEDGEPQPQLWTLQRHKSRIVGCIPGHYNWTFDDPLARVMVLRSICWAAKLDNADRLAELSLVGARWTR
ncbi:MAG TPA: ThuA domain-containing protein [Verrucomicrobiae bacterium]|nr:ThuA domain-containing protein [Verrucomicrobiae bacterium]